MKTLPLLLVIMLVSLTASAQQAETLTRKEQRIERREYFKTNRIQYHHDLRVGIGIMATGGFYRPMVKLGDSYSSSATPYIYYGYRFHGGWKVAMTLGYNQTQHKTKEYDSFGITSRDVYELYNHNLRISPSLQYEWYRRGIVTMYSDIGFTWIIPSGHRDSFDKYKPAGYIQPNITPFGITVGSKHWFGAAEVLSFGARGLFNIAAGYRF